MNQKQLNIPEMRLKQYEIVQLIGSGGFCKVYHARLLMNSNKINTHILLWSIVIVIPPYEYIIKGDIEKLRSDNNKQFSQEQVILYVKQILKRIQDLHQYNIMHKDVKMKNIFLNNDSIQLGDFGFSICKPKLYACSIIIIIQ